jgi:small subunit ribosomal protein S11
MGARTIEVNMQGPGSGRDSVVRALQSSGLAVTLLRDVTPLPHNGARPAKKRRV